LVRRNQGLFAGVTIVAAALVLGLTVSVVSLVGEQQARRVAVAAQEKEVAWRRHVQAQAYASDMSLAQQALAADDLGRARRLLEGHRPAPGEVDLRGWEWRYLWQECRSDALAEFCRYPNSAFSVAYSPNGKMLAVAGLIQNFVEVWDVPGHKRIATLQPKEGHLVAFSPRGDLLATDAGKQIRLWRTGTMDLVGQLTVPGSVQVLQFSPDGSRLASLGFPDEAIVWEVDQWAVVRRICGVRLVNAFSGALDFSPDSQALVSGDAYGRLQAVDVASGNTSLDIPEAHSGAIHAVAWSPTGSVIASGGFSDGAIRLWDAASGKLLGTLEGHTSWMRKLIFSADGLRLYSASADQTIRIWEVGQRRCLATLRGSSHEIYGLALSPDGATLASAGKDGVVAFWSAVPRPKEEQPRLIPLGRFSRPAFAPDRRVLALPRAGTVSLFDLTTSKEIEQLPALGTDISMVVYSPDGTLLVSGGRSGKIRVWSCAERRLLRELEDPRAPIYRVAFRADGRRLLSVDAQGKTVWWDTRTWQAVRAFAMSVKPSWLESHCSVAVAPSGRLLAVGTMTGAVRWLNAETGELLATTTGSHLWPVVGVAFSGDGTPAASVCGYGTVALWDSSSFKLIAAFRGHMLGAQGVASSPDGRRLATSGGSGSDAVKLWDSSTHRELVTLAGRGSIFNFVAFSPDGRWLAACSWEGNLHLWHAPSWDQIEAAENGPEAADDGSSETSSRR
jgi:WD40 repeat protein